MPVNADIKLASFSPQIRGFDNSLQSTSSLKGGIGEYIQALFNIRFYWYTEPLEIIIHSNGGEIERQDGKSFKDEGFSVGDQARLQYGQFGVDIGAGTVFFNITGISENGFRLFTDANIPSFNGPISNDLLSEDHGILITGLTTLDNAKYSFGLIENNEPFNTFSKLTGEDQRYLVKNILGATNGEISGNIKGWASSVGGSVQFTNQANSIIPVYRGDDFGSSGGTVPDAVQNFSIVHKFPVLPFYTVGQLNNLRNGVSPDFLKGENSLAYRFAVEMSTSISSTDQEKKLEVESLQGSVGFFGENFNGLQTQYSIDSIVYDVSGQPNDSLLAEGVTSVTVIASSQESTFTASQNVVISHSYLPQDEDEYINSESFFEDNFIFEAIEKDASGNVVKNVTTTLLAANSLQINFDIDTSNTSRELTADDVYLLAIVLDDDNKTAEESDRTALRLDINNYDKSPDIPDLFFVDELINYDHVTDVSNTGNTDYKGWVQDGYAVKGIFRLDRSKFAFINTFFVDIVAWKDGTNEYFTIQSNEFNLSDNVIDADGNQQINIELLQGFKLDELDQFNQKQITTGAYDGTFIEYDFLLGLKINWQDWLSLPNADAIFYDVSQPNNGLNQNASRYSLKEGYTLQTIVRADILETEQNIVTEYIHKSQIIANDFSEIGAEDWSGVIETEREDNGADANGKVLGTGRSTIIRAVFTPNFSATPVVDDFEGVIRIVEQLPQGDKTIYELSSVRSSQPNNLLIPLDGESLVKVSVVGTTLVLECRTDKALIQDVNYTLSARLFGPAQVVIGDFNDDFNNDFFV